MDDQLKVFRATFNILMGKNPLLPQNESKNPNLLWKSKEEVYITKIIIKSPNENIHCKPRMNNLKM